MPDIVFPETLPITAALPQIEALVQNHSVIIIGGETGSGKSTQLPKLALKMGLCSPHQRIGHTQPRRIAARTLAHRIASELKTPVGDQVGYQVRFDQKMSANTAIKLMTDGILLQELHSDPDLKKYSVLLIDEAHERSVNIDLLLAHLKKILKKRRDLKVMVTSATLNLAAFADYFNAPFLEIQGRTYPVEIRYHDLSLSKTPVEEAVAPCVSELMAETTGHILVFLPTEKDIREQTQIIMSQQGRSAEVLPLYSRLNLDAQHAVFQPSGRRKIILATNVAETSITIPGVTAVIDTGLARTARYHAQNKIMRLPIERISQAESAQRAGRAGREQPGICIRLESEVDWQTRPRYRDPEILRTHMAQVILRQKALGLVDLDTLDLIDPPPPGRIRDGHQLLRVLGALTADHTITPIGYQMAKIPLDPRWSRALLAGEALGCGLEIAVIVTALSLPDFREDRQKNWPDRFYVAGSDFLLFLKLWGDFEPCSSIKKTRVFSKKYGLSFKRLREWRLLYEEMKNAFPELPPPKTDADPLLIHQALLTGLIDQIGIKQPKGFYLGTHHVHFHLGAGSILRKKKPNVILSSGILELHQPIAPLGAALEWADVNRLLQAHPEVKKKHQDPFWSLKSGRVEVHEKRTFLGLSLPDQTCAYEKIDFEDARRFFIQQGLVLQQIRSEHPRWLKHQQAVSDLKIWALKIQDWRIMLTEDELFAHYDAALPAIANQRDFEHFLQQEICPFPFVRNHLKTFEKSHGCPLDSEHYPDHLAHPHLTIPVVYTEDTIRVDVPLTALSALNEISLSWPFRGYLKNMAESFSFSNEAHAALHDGYGQLDFQVAVKPYVADLSSFLKKIARYQVAYHVHDFKSARTWISRSLSKLKQELQQEIQAAHDALLRSQNIRPIHHAQEWIWDDLSQPITCAIPQGPLHYYPALQDDQHQVTLTHEPDAHIAEKKHAQGVLRLLLLQLKKTDQAVAMRWFGRQLPGNLPKNKTDFLKMLKQCQSAIARDIPTRTLLKQISEKQDQLKGLHLPPKAMIFWENTMDTWLGLDFWPHVPEAYFKRFPLYAEALRRQIQKVIQSKSDRAVYQAQLDFEHFWNLSLQAWSLNPAPHVMTFRCLVEELRIALFAQDLKTVQSISTVKLNQFIHEKSIF